MPSALDSAAPGQPVGERLAWRSWRARITEFDRDHAIRLDPEIDGVHALQAPHEQAGANQQHHRQRGLHHRETGAQSPDVGGIKRARSFAKFFHAELAVCDKYRKEANKVTSMRLIGEVDGKDVVLVDDLVDTGGTICKAATLLKEKGAKSVRAVCTHPVLSANAYENIENSNLEELVVTDTIPLKKESDKIKVLTVSDLFAKAIRKIHDHESISSLFIRL
jgi:ribose-phosphate pyrophosphokinase